ncbi:MAG TPA: DUF6491 family protein, partial [Verrucomicrobiae bacterium]|nr:DUF6491 family protein [Verrucomicrobiae bacterium]
SFAANMIRMGIAIVTALALSACATSESTQNSAARDCFRAEDVSGYSVIDDHNIGVRVGASRNYVLSTTWNARDLDWTHAIAIRSGAGFICTGNGLGVELIGGEPRRNYPVTSITRATTDQPEPTGS